MLCLNPCFTDLSFSFVPYYRGLYYVWYKVCNQSLLRFIAIFLDGVLIWRFLYNTWSLLSFPCSKIVLFQSFFVLHFKTKHLLLNVLFVNSIFIFEPCIFKIVDVMQFQTGSWYYYYIITFTVHILAVLCLL